MKLFRKVMSGLLAGSLILSLVACGAGPGATETGDPSGNGAVGTPSASGDEIVVNVSDNVTLYMRDGIISHANHYKHPHMPRPPYRQMDIYPKDELRSFRLDYLVENLHGNELGIRDIMEILSDHGVNYPASICQHLPECATNFSTVTDLNKKEMYIATGNPCGGYIFVRPFEE